MEVKIKRLPDDVVLADLDVVIPCPRSFNFTISMSDSTSSGSLGDLMEVQMRTSNESLSRFLGFQSSKMSESLRKRLEISANKSVCDCQKSCQERSFSWLIWIALAFGLVYLILVCFDMLHAQIRRVKVKEMSGSDFKKLKFFYPFVRTTRRSRKSKSILKNLQILPLHLRILVALVLAWKCMEMVLCTYTMLLLLSTIFFGSERELQVLKIGNISDGNMKETNLACNHPLEDCHGPSLEKNRQQFLNDCLWNLSYSLFDLKRQVEECLDNSQLDLLLNKKKTNLLDKFMARNTSLLRSKLLKIWHLYQATTSEKLTNPRALLDWLPPFGDDPAGAWMDGQSYFTTDFPIQGAGRFSAMQVESFFKE